jgi:hypothetical protein
MDGGRLAAGPTRPPQSAFGFVTGATMANFTGLASDGQRRSLLPFSGLIPD